MQQSLYTFFEQCDRWRTNYENGEAQWQEMMNNRVALADNMEEAEEAFLLVADPHPIIEVDEETIAEYTSDDPESMIYRSTVNGSEVYFIYTAGFEYIFTKDGNSP